MYVQTQLLNCYSKLLWYTIPDEWKSDVSIGSIITVPLRNKNVSASVIHIAHIKPKFITFEVKSALQLEKLPDDNLYQSFVQSLATYYQINPVYIIKRITSFLEQDKNSKKIDFVEVVDIQKSFVSSVQLTKEQQKFCDYILPEIETGNYAPTVLHGVTGSGKTECYKKAMVHALELQKTALLLLPEVSLAVAFEERLKKELPEQPIFGFHSGKTAKEKKELWQRLKEKQPILIIGVHLPLFLPISNLGLIIVDEEHETGYQEKRHPKIHTRDAAVMRAHQYNIPIVLGSATPTISTLYNVEKRGWKLFTLYERFASSFPIIQKVSLLENKQRKYFWITKELQKALAHNISKGEQSIIFINRRGISFFVQCKQCSFIFSCDACSVSLTLHESNILLCHYCGIKKILPNCCPSCSAEEKNFLKKGAGTQGILSSLEKLFPHARIARADLDVTAKKKAWHEIIKKMHANEIDILVGTQTIAKGLHFANVSLVGVIWADLNVHFPIYNATETSLQQLIQVAGRAGRSGQASKVIVQTMGSHPILDYINEEEYLKFFKKESEIRELFAYPPFSRLVEIELKHSSEIVIDHEAQQIAVQLRMFAKKNNIKITILGPSKPPVHKVQNMHSRKLYIKGVQISDCILVYKQIKKDALKCSIFFTPNPMSL